MKSKPRRSKNWYCLICLASKSYNVSQEQEPSDANPKLFPLPTTKLDLHRWKKQIRDFIPPSDNSLDDAAICSLHFADDDFDKYSKLPEVDSLLGNTIPFVSNELIDAVACERGRHTLKTKCHFPEIFPDTVPVKSTDLRLDLSQSCRICLLDLGVGGRLLASKDRAKINAAGLRFENAPGLPNWVCQSCSRDLSGDLAKNATFQMNLEASNALVPHLSNDQQINVGEYQMTVVGKLLEQETIVVDDYGSENDNSEDEDVIEILPPEVVAKQKKRYFYYCYHCPKTYGEKHMLLLHLMTKHFPETKQELEPKFQCELCAKSFAFAPELRAHRNTVHSKKPPRNYPKLKRTAGADSQERQKVECPICSRLIIKNSLATHIRAVHKRTHDHHCTVCDKSFFRRKYLDDHIMACHPEQLDPNAEELACHYCAFKTKNTLRYKRHILQQHPEVRQRPFACGICSKEFVFAESLSRHRRAQHSKDGLYECKECGKVMRSSVSILAHKRMHAKMRETLGDWRDYIIT